MAVLTMLKGHAMMKNKNILEDERFCSINS